MNHLNTLGLRSFVLAIPLLLSLLLSSLLSAKEISPSQVGAAQLEQYLPLLSGKKVGLVVNQTSRAHGQHLVDLLLENRINVSTIFAPEHGFRGDIDAGANVDSGIDSKTGLPIVSIYGKNKKPSPEVLAELDVIVFDIQDVGTRFYTYISSMLYMMQAASEQGLSFVVLDRPNPNIHIVDGPMLEPEFRSFVGMFEIPMVHGLTVGELAQMILGEGWLSIESERPASDYTLDLTVIPVKNYSRSDTYDLPVKPSPNLPNRQAIALYPSLCFFEATPISIGRGTDFPFQVIGHDKVSLGNFNFTPVSTPGAAVNPKLKDQLLQGVDLTQVAVTGLELSWFYQWHQAFAAKELPFFQFPKFMDKLAGTDKLRLAMEQGVPLPKIIESWQPALDSYQKRRKPYLMYP